MEPPLEEYRASQTAARTCQSKAALALNAEQNYTSAKSGSQLRGFPKKKCKIGESTFVQDLLVHGRNFGVSISATLVLSSKSRKGLRQR